MPTFGRSLPTAKRSAIGRRNDEIVKSPSLGETISMLSLIVQRHQRGFTNEDRSGFFMNSNVKGKGAGTNDCDDQTNGPKLIQSLSVLQRTFFQRALHVRQ